MVDKGVEFRCQLHFCALMRISGSCVNILEGCCASFDDCLVVWGGKFQDELGPIMIALVTLDGRRVVAHADSESLLVKVFFGRSSQLAGLPCWFWCCFAVLLCLGTELFPFSRKQPTWKLRALGHVANILTAGWQGCRPCACGTW